MSRIPQDVYASNLLRRQSFGYPLRNPRPKDKSNQESFRIGDVGHVDENGEFNILFNISFLPKELQDPDWYFDPAQPAAKPAFSADKIFMTGVKQNLGPRSQSEPRCLHTTCHQCIIDLTWHLKGRLCIYYNRQRRCHTYTPGRRYPIRARGQGAVGQNSGVCCEMRRSMVQLR